MEIAEFLLARIAEDDAVARAVVSDLLADDQDSVSEEWFHTYDATNIWPSHLAHIARHDPTRVSTECDAKRRLIKSLVEDLHTALDYHGTPIALDALEMLALPYADHPDYDESWRL